MAYATAQNVLKNKKVSLAAIDSTGLEAGHISAYFVRRRSRENETGSDTFFSDIHKKLLE